MKAIWQKRCLAAVTLMCVSVVVWPYKYFDSSAQTLPTSSYASDPDDSFEFNRLQTRGAMGDDTDAKQRERSFLMNLHRMAGQTAAVNLDTMMELCAEASSRGLTDLAPILQQYTSSILTHPALQLRVNSLQSLRREYEDAIKQDNVEFLLSVRNAHRRARAVLDTPVTNTLVHKIINDIEVGAKRRLYSQLMRSVEQYVVEYGGSDSIGRALEKVLPELVSEESLVAVGMPPAAAVSVATALSQIGAF